MSIRSMVVAILCYFSHDKAVTKPINGARILFCRRCGKVLGMVKET